MSVETISFLQTRVTALESENASLKAENKDRRLKYKGASTELEDLKKQLGTLTAERDQLKARADAGPKELNDKIASLESSLRARDHRDAFASVKEFEVTGKDGKPVKYKLRDGVTADAVMKQLDHKAEGETPKAEAIKARLGEALQTHSFLFAEAAAPDGAQRPFTLPSREAGPGGGKGPDSPTVTAAQGGKVAYTAAQVSGRI